jgi:outer membrane protein OmpA-like peptidoglycan-associated protein/opacity protein-like surface antigen
MFRRYTQWLAVIAVALTAIGTAFGQQDVERHAPWRFGLNLGLNYNMAGVGYAKWDGERSPDGRFIPLVVNDGSGIGPYIGLNAEYVSRSWWGIGARLSYDSRNLTAYDDQSFTKPDGSFFKDEFRFSNQYLALEPRLLIRPMADNGFHLSLGPSLHLAMNSTYDYTIEGGAVRTGVELPDAASLTTSFAFGFGWDFMLNDKKTAEWGYFVSPFLETTWLLAQRGVDYSDLQGSFDDALSTVTIRAGVSLKLGKMQPELTDNNQSTTFFTITPPEDGISDKVVVDEFYPLIPYVFFDRNNQDIPGRYVKLSPGQGAEFLDRFPDLIDVKSEKPREYRQGEVYYNIMNLFGNRLKQSPTETVTLIGSDPVEKDGDILSDRVKQYLVDVWGIDPARISTKGQVNPRVVSGTARTPTEDKPFAEIENRRVEFDFKNKQLMREVHLVALRDATIENDIRIELNTNEQIESWTVRIQGNGVNRSFGPFFGMEELISATGFLSNAPSGRFFAEVTARTADGRTLNDTKSFELRRAAEERKSARFSIVFDYAEDDPIKRYDQFLQNEAAERIPDGAVVVVHGHTDNIGREESNKRLSLERAKAARESLMKGLRAKGKRNVKVYAIGRGEDTTYAPFDNSTPEGRQYNRTVIIDIVPRR